MQSLRLKSASKEERCRLQAVNPQLQEMTSLAEQLQVELHQSRLQVRHLSNEKEALEQQLADVYSDCEVLRASLGDVLTRVREVEREARQAHRLRARVCALEAKVAQFRGDTTSNTGQCALTHNKVLSASLDSQLETNKWTLHDTKELDRNGNDINKSEHRKVEGTKNVRHSLAGCLVPTASMGQPTELTISTTSTPDIFAKLQFDITALTQERTDLYQEKEKVERQLRLKELESQEKDAEMQSVESERMRLGLLEDKMGDIIEILRGMRRKKVASYIIGTYITDIIDEMVALTDTLEETTVEMFVRLLQQKLCKSTLLPCLDYHEFEC